MPDAPVKNEEENNPFLFPLLENLKKIVYNIYKE